MTSMNITVQKTRQSIQLFFSFSIAAVYARPIRSVDQRLCLEVHPLQGPSNR